MSLKNAKPGAMSVGHYQISSIPWVTSSQLTGGKPASSQYDLPRLSRFVTLKNTSKSSGQTYTAQFALGFTSGAFANAGDTLHEHAYYLGNEEEVTFDIRVDSFFLSASKGSPTFSILAGLTMIGNDMQPRLTGSLGGAYSGVG